MSYDSDGNDSTAEPFTPAAWEPCNPRDLEVLVTLLEIAAIELSPTAGATFTRDEVVALALEIGDDAEMRASDLRVVLAGANFLRREPGGRWSLK